MLSSRQRVSLALAHREPDRVPLDLGGSPVTGMHASSVYLLRQALQLDPPGTPVKIVEPHQMLGEIAADLIDALQVDVLPLSAPATFFGFRNEGWKPWALFDGTPVLVPRAFNTEPEPNGDILMYPEGDRSAPASGRMPHGGYYFDSIIRQHPIDEARLNPEDNLEEFLPLSAGDLAYYRRQAERLYTTTDKAIFANPGGTAFGDISLVPAPWLRHPRGIRDVQEWYIFWGGGIDTQRTLPFGTAGEVRREVEERLHIFAPGGGFVFNTVHNVQAHVPVANLLALYETLQQKGRYPLP